ETAEKISKGDLSQRVLVDQKNEFGRMAEAFNTMTESLAEAKEGLEEKVAELDKSNDALRKFASVVSHDLKAPLSRI
ncbi:HAMP domain-containing protein, partial [Streptococcus pyogenes]